MSDDHQLESLLENLNSSSSVTRAATTAATGTAATTHLIHPHSGFSQTKLKFDFGNRTTFPVPPPTECTSLFHKSNLMSCARGVSNYIPMRRDVGPFFYTVLSRVQAFLPQLQASNALLEKRMHQDPESVDIEHLSEGMDQYIEMVSVMWLFPLIFFPLTCGSVKRPQSMSGCQSSSPAPTHCSDQYGIWDQLPFTSS